MSNIIFIDGSATIKWTTFSDGTETCKITPERIQGSHGYVEREISNKIQVHIQDGTRDLIRIGLVKDALDRLGIKNVTLTLMYMPQARADRVFEKGMPLPIKVFADILNSFGFDKVYLFDPHSDVTPALINNVEVITQQRLVYNLKIDSGTKFTLCAPDLGATKKTFDAAKALGHDKFYQAIKVRDVTTGDIVACDLVEKEVSGRVLIIDDISDGGASFKHLAKLLKERGASQVDLYVTHGIFSKGLEVMKPEIDNIFVENIVGNFINVTDIWQFNE